MRVAIICCISLFFFFFKGNEGAHAETTRITQGHEFFNNHPQAKKQHTPFHKTANLHIQKNSSSIEINCVEEVQNEDENLSGKGIIRVKEALYFCCSLFAAEKINKKIALPYCEHLSYTANFKYLLLKVFRI